MDSSRAIVDARSAGAGLEHNSIEALQSDQLPLRLLSDKDDHHGSLIPLSSIAVANEVAMGHGTEMQSVQHSTCRPETITNVLIEKTFEIQANRNRPGSSSSIDTVHITGTSRAGHGTDLRSNGGAIEQNRNDTNETVEDSTTSRPNIRQPTAADRSYWGPPIVSKIQIFKFFQIRLLRNLSIGREPLTWKTSKDLYPWSTMLVVPVGEYDIVLLRRVSNRRHFGDLKFPDGGRQSNMFLGRLPPLPSEILANWDYCQANKEVRHRPVVGDRDNPVKALYRLYATIILDYDYGMRIELEYFCNHVPIWYVDKIPDPRDPDPARYAMLAAITSILVLALNARIKIGLHRDNRGFLSDGEREAQKTRKPKWEREPGWAKRVPPLKETLFLPEVNGDVVRDPEAAGVCIPFKEKNILMKTPHFYFT